MILFHDIMPDHLYSLNKTCSQILTYELKQCGTRTGEIIYNIVNCSDNEFYHCNYCNFFKWNVNDVNIPYDISGTVRCTTCGNAIRFFNSGNAAIHSAMNHCDIKKKEMLDKMSECNTIIDEMNKTFDNITKLLTNL